MCSRVLSDPGKMIQVYEAVPSKKVYIYTGFFTELDSSKKTFKVVFDL